MTAGGGQAPAGSGDRAQGGALGRQNLGQDDIAEILAAHDEAIGALTEGLSALTAAIRAINAAFMDDRPRKRRWWR